MLFRTILEQLRLLICKISVNSKENKLTVRRKKPKY